MTVAPEVGASSSVIVVEASVRRGEASVAVSLSCESVAPSAGLSVEDASPLPSLLGPPLEHVGQCIRMQLILRPPLRVVMYVFADAVQRPLVADDMLPVVALSEPRAGGAAHAIHAPGRHRFVVSHNRPQRSRLWGEASLTTSLSCGSVTPDIRASLEDAVAGDASPLPPLRLAPIERVGRCIGMQFVLRTTVLSPIAPQNSETAAATACCHPPRFGL